MNGTSVVSLTLCIKTHSYEVKLYTIIRIITKAIVIIQITMCVLVCTLMFIKFCFNFPETSVNSVI